MPATVFSNELRSDKNRQWLSLSGTLSIIWLSPIRALDRLHFCPLPVPLLLLNSKSVKHTLEMAMTQ